MLKETISYPWYYDQSEIVESLMDSRHINAIIIIDYNYKFL